MNDRLLLVIPCFRESTRVGPFLDSLCALLTEQDGVSLLVVDDGSGADEAARLRALVDARREAHSFLRPLLELPVNVGKGGAVYAGWAAHQGEPWLAFADADGSVSAKEILRIATLARSGASSVFASRVRMLGRSVERLWHRHLIGRIFASLVSSMLQVPVYDSQCGFKIVPRDAFEHVKENLVVRRYAFDVELLVALLGAGTDVLESPVDWHEVAGAKIRLVRDSCRMFRDLRLIRRRKRSGLYSVAVTGLHKNIAPKPIKT